MSIYFSQFFTGISIGAVLLLIALGLTFTFGQMNVINMAHGEFIMAGAYSVYLLQGLSMSAGVALMAALPVGFIAAGLMGLALEWLLIKRLYGRSLDTLLVTWGVSLMLQQLARDIFGAPNVQVKAPTWLGGGLTVSGVVMPYTRLFILALVTAAIGGIAVFLGKLPAGRAMRAVMQNRQLASCSGIGTDRIDRTTFFIGSGLAGIAGVALTLLGSIGPTLGTNYIVDAFLVVVVGGLGQLKGTVIAAFVLGLLNAYVEYWTQASFAKVAVFVAIVVFLQIRPQGLVSVRARGLT
jgi:urea transport system permease protein